MQLVAGTREPFIRPGKLLLLHRSTDTGEVCRRLLSALETRFPGRVSLVDETYAGSERHPADLARLAAATCVLLVVGDRWGEAVSGATERGSPDPLHLELERRDKARTIITGLLPVDIDYPVDGQLRADHLEPFDRMFRFRDRKTLSTRHWARDLHAVVEWAEAIGLPGKNRAKLLGAMRSMLFDQGSVYARPTAWVEPRLRSRPDLLGRHASRPRPGSEFGLDQLVANPVGRTLLAGAPGVGRSTLLWELARRWLKLAQEDETHPVPLLVHGGDVARRARIGGSRGPLQEHIADRYGVPASLVDFWITRGWIVLCFDEIDAWVECLTRVDRERSRDAIQRLRALACACLGDSDFPANVEPDRGSDNDDDDDGGRGEGGESGAVSTLDAVIEVLPPDARILEELLDKHRALPAVRELVRSEALMEAQRSPLLLELVLERAQARRVPVQVTDATGAALTRSELIEGHVRFALERVRPGDADTADRTRRALRWLAAYMRRSKRTSFRVTDLRWDSLIHGMEPSEYRRAAILYWLVLTTLAAFVTLPLSVQLEVAMGASSQGLAFSVAGLLLAVLAPMAAALPLWGAFEVSVSRILGSARRGLTVGLWLAAWMGVAVVVVMTLGVVSALLIGRAFALPPNLVETPVSSLLRAVVWMFFACALLDLLHASTGGRMHLPGKLGAGVVALVATLFLTGGSAAMDGVAQSLHAAAELLAKAQFQSAVPEFTDLLGTYLLPALPVTVVGDVVGAA